MSTNLKRRLEVLERLGGKTGSSDPARIHEVMANSGIETPEPLPGEDAPAWMKRVPTASLEALMNLRGALCPAVMF
ncbi:hypothetical protein [Halomonas sp. CSM-2]|uniref:hypothetical protein n=1 Tax=Halomonas sp. CSM-2 TaxID=1975722 RepID=UPI000A28A2E3|nr:hypothetical protein [Halomonas sp. CSM-2]